MECALNNAMCRCCASEGTFKDIKTKYHWMGEEEVYADMLTECFDIKILTTEDADNGICEVCITQLRNAANFKKQVLHTEEQFKKRLDSKAFKNPIKLESADDPADSDHLSDVDAEFSGTEYDVSIKEEAEEKPKARKRAAKPTTSRAKKTKTETKSIGRTAIKAIDAKPALDLKFVSMTPKRPLRKRSALSWTLSRQNQHNLIQILLNSNASPIRHHDQRGYSCVLCPEQYLEPQALKEHFLVEHNDERLIVKHMTEQSLDHAAKLDISHLNCAYCEVEIANLDEFMLHLVNEHDIHLYLDIKSQILPFKFESSTLNCVVCSAQYDNFKLLQEHMNAHYRNYICDICDSGFVTERCLERHVKRHEDGEFNCEHCGKTFTSEEKRREHVKRTHLGFGKRNKCTYCDERFSDYWQKVDHMVKNHGVPRPVYKCQACDRSFSNQRSLSRHTKKDHLLERKHKCPECDKSFYGSGNLRKHMTKHTGVKEHTCEVCSKAFSRRNTLTEHMRIHTNDRRFSCGRCGQTFIQKCSLKGHLMSKHSETM